QPAPSATVADVKDFFARFYVPRNASLVVAGDFDTARAKELVHQFYGKIPGGNAPPHAGPRLGELEGGKRPTLPHRVQLPRVSMVYHSPPGFAPGDADLDLAATLLGEGKSSRLYRALVYERKIAQDVDVTQDSSLLGSLFEIEVTARPGQ